MYGIRKKEAKKIAEEIKNKTGINLSGTMEKIKMNPLSIILVDKEPVILEYNNSYYLTVYGILKFKPEKNKVTVDEGAKEFILNGADVMRPGITQVDENIKKGDFVYIEVENFMPVAVGIALMNGNEMKTKDKGKAVKNIHHIGDKIWNFLLKEGYLSLGDKL